MIKVTLLGDSIRLIGYGKKVPELLGDDFEIFQPDINCKFAKFTLRGLFDWESNMAGSRIVHWNNGLWDVCDLFGDGTFSTETEYVQNMLRIADLLLAKYEKVIFATTTPVAKENQYNRNSDIEKFNAAIVPLLKEKGIIINDLHTLVVDNVDSYISKEDHIHLSQEGIEACAKQVADVICAAAETLSSDYTGNFDSKTIQSSVGAPV
jgi:hypothetical protein